MRPAMSAAVCVFAALIIWFGVLDGSKTPYAQMIQRLERARTVHLVVKRLQDGELQPTDEVWYDRDAGSVAWNYREGKSPVMRIDDGTTQWEHTDGTDYCVRSESKGRGAMPEEIADILELRSIAEFLGRAGDPVRRESIDGIDCEVYEATNLSATPEYSRLGAAWIDGNMRFRKCMKWRLDEEGEWLLYSLADIEYDVSIDKSRFKPDFGPGVKVLDAAEPKTAERMYPEQFDLGKAIYTYEAEGHIFAVHELKRCEDDFVYLVCSTRPTEETIREFGPVEYQGNIMTCYAYPLLLGCYERLEDGTPVEYNSPPGTFAEFYFEGLVVKWAVSLQMPGPPENADTYRLGVQICTSSGSPRIRKPGDKDYFDPLVTLPLPQEKTSISDVAAAIRKDTLALEPIAWDVRLTLGFRPAPGSEGQLLAIEKKPSEISLSEFEDICTTRLDHLKSDRGYTLY
jgi:hypothetical protein